MLNEDASSEMPSPSSSSIVEFQCPACRARQPLQETCRRCQADLGLLAKIHRRMDHLAKNPSPTHDEELAAYRGIA